MSGAGTNGASKAEGFGPGPAKPGFSFCGSRAMLPVALPAVLLIRYSSRLQALMAAKVPGEGKRVQTGGSTASLFSVISTRTGLQQPMTLQRLALRLRHCHAPRTGRKASCSQFPGEKSPRFGVWGPAEQFLVGDCADRSNTFDPDAGTHHSRRRGDCGLGQLARRALCPGPLARSATFPFFIPACHHTQPRPQTRAALPSRRR